MLLSENAYLILVLVIGIVLVSVAIFVYTAAPHNQQTGSPVASIKSETPPVPSGWKRFKNVDMNLEFTYPEALQLYQPKPQIAVLVDPAHSEEDHALLIYVTQSPANEQSVDVKVPFAPTSQLIKSEPIQLQGFQAVMSTYGDASNQTQILLMKHEQVDIFLRLPQHQTSALNQSVITSILASIRVPR